jgi:hypothetical protein
LKFPQSYSAPIHATLSNAPATMSVPCEAYPDQNYTVSQLLRAAKNRLQSTDLGGLFVFSN